MSEFITLQIGQCGNQIGGSFWPLVLDEYSLNPNDNSSKKEYLSDLLVSLDSFFYVPPNISHEIRSYSDFKASKIKARAVLIDMEEGVIGRYKNSPFKDLFDDKFIITNSPGSGNNWAEGYYTHGRKFKNKILNAVRQLAERSDNLQGFIFTLSTGGGTGSGLGTYCLRLLEDNYPNVDRFVSCVYPLGCEDVITCPYNMALSTKQLIDHASCVFPAENRALTEMIAVEAKRKGPYNEKAGFFAQNTTFDNMNNIIVNSLLHLTCGSRFSGTLNMDMSDISTNLVPFPKMNFLSSGITPIFTPLKKAIFKIKPKLKEEMFHSIRSKGNQLIKINPVGPTSVLLSAAVQARGDVNNSDLRKFVEKLQDRGNFTSWSRKAVKVGHCAVAPQNCQVAMMSLFNTTTMSELFSHINLLFKRLYNRKAHIHHYTQTSGFESDYFQECSESLLNIIEMYRQTETASSNCIPRLCSSETSLV